MTTLDTLQHALQARQHTAPKRLVAPGPTAGQLHQLFEAAATAPDHGRITPWRFVVIENREGLADIFAQALLDRDPNASAEQVEDARSKAHRAPCLILAIARLQTGEEKIPDSERWLSLGAAMQNILLTATSMGLGSGLSSGQALASQALRTRFQLNPNEQAACFISLGTVSQDKPPHARRTAEAFVSRFE